MNVIITQDKSVRITQPKNSAYDIQEITFYIAKQIPFQVAQCVLKKYRNKYPFLLKKADHDTFHYNIYKVVFTQPVSLSQREYDISVVLDNAEIEIGTFEMQLIRRR